MTLGERLRRGIESAGHSVRAFHREMEARGVSGSSYPNIHRYLADNSEPALGFLREAADLLGVRYEWLAVGQGPMKETEASVESRRDELTQELETALMPLSVTGDADLIRETFLATLARLAVLAESDGKKLSDEDVGKLAHRLTTFINRGIPDHVLGDLKSEQMRFTLRRHADGILALLHAVMTWAPDPSEKHTEPPTTDQEETDGTS